MLKYDWIRLKDEFVRGKWFSVSDFLKDKEIANNSYTRTKTKGWKNDKTVYLKRIVSKTQEKTVDSESEIRYRQSKIAKRLQVKGFKNLESLEVNSVDEARKLITEGLNQEREALNLNSQHTTTQINLDITGTSEVDKMAEGMSYEEILELIALVRKEKQRRLSLVGSEV